jgi:hypothetical protein
MSSRGPWTGHLTKQRNSASATRAGSVSSIPITGGPTISALGWGCRARDAMLTNRHDCLRVGVEG